MSDRNQQLEVTIKDGQVTITVGVDLICFAVGHFDEMEAVEITDNDTFIKDLVSELRSEDEQGTTLIQSAFDRAAVNCVENGADGCEVE